MDKDSGKGTNCPFCLSGNASVGEKLISKLNSKSYFLYQCNNCGLHFFTPLKFENIYENELDKSYVPFHKGRDKLPAWSRKISQTIKSLKLDLDDKEILDVGAGDAINYKMLSEDFGIRPENYYAIELDKKSLASAKKRGVVNIINQYFDKNMLKMKKKFDIIIASEVLEHQVNPKEFIETSFKLLKPNGVFMVTVPNRDRLLFKYRSIPEDAPPHHFLRFDKDFFRNNFKEGLIMIGHYSYGLTDLKESSVRFSETFMKSRRFWALFLPAVLAIRILDLWRGIGIIAIMRKVD